MGKDFSRVQRGQVYWFNPSESYGEPTEYTAYNGKVYKSSVQNYNRPWLVTSNNAGNSTSPTCNIVPITSSEEKAVLPVHVNFVFGGKKQTILVEQPRTVDCLALKSYMYTVSDDVMEKVERAIAIQHNIRPQVTYTDFTLDNTINHLESIIAKIIAGKVDQIREELQKEQTPPGCIPVSQIEDAATNLGHMIEELVTEKVKPVVQEVIKDSTEPKPDIKPHSTVKAAKNTSYKGMSAVEKFNARYNLDEKPHNTTDKESPKESTSEQKKTNTTRNYWTPEKRLQYLEDCKNMSLRGVQEKYRLGSIKSVTQTKYLHKTALIKLGLLKVEDK